MINKIFKILFYIAIGWIIIELYNKFFNDENP